MNCNSAISGCPIKRMICKHNRYCHQQLKAHADLSHQVCASISHWRTDFSVNTYFVPWESSEIITILGMSLLRPKKNKGLYWENNANILKTKTWIANDCGTAACDKGCDRGSCSSQYEASCSYLSCIILTFLSLSSLNIVSLTHETLFSERNKSQEKNKACPNDNCKGTYAGFRKKQL